MHGCCSRALVLSFSNRGRWQATLSRRCRTLALLNLTECVIIKTTLKPVAFTFTLLLSWRSWGKGNVWTFCMSRHSWQCMVYDSGSRLTWANHGNAAHYVAISVDRYSVNTKAAPRRVGGWVSKFVTCSEWLAWPCDESTTPQLHSLCCTAKIVEKGVEAQRLHVDVSGTPTYAWEGTGRYHQPTLNCRGVPHSSREAPRNRSGSRRCRKISN